MSRTNIVIAHRGASGYLPEHTLPSAALAHHSGADYVELDLVLTKDDELIVLHDLTLEATTDVEEKFPSRRRKDGHWYAIDFALNELRTLNVHERAKDPRGTLQFPNRFPYGKSRFSIPTFDEIVELVQGLNQTTGRKVGIYVELKDPQFHTKAQKNLAGRVVAALQRYGYVERDSGAIVQCFDPETLKVLRQKMGVKLPLVQLIGTSAKDGETDWTHMKSPAGLKDVATYADGIGPWLQDLFDARTFEPKPLLTFAIQSRLPIHAYTLRSEQLPPGVTFEATAKMIYSSGVSGIFTDQPDRLANVVRLAP